jgi:hypothetical protein
VVNTFIVFCFFEHINFRAANSEYFNFFGELNSFEAQYLLSKELERKYGDMSTSMHLDQMLSTRDNDAVK